MLAFLNMCKEMTAVLTVRLRATEIVLGFGMSAAKCIYKVKGKAIPVTGSGGL
jgi:hypothetical protein